MTAVKLAVALLTSLVITGCSVTEFYRPDGTLERRSLSVAPIVVVPTRNAPAVRVRAVGLSAGPWQATVGYSDLTVIRPYKTCSAFIFVRNAAEARKWAEYASTVNGLCKGDTQ